MKAFRKRKAFLYIYAKPINMTVKLLFAGAAALFCSASFSQNLVLDSDFGSAGKTLTSFGVDDSILATLALQPDGKIVACGSYYRYNPAPNSYPHVINQVALSRYNPDGSIDTGFGTNGKAIIPVGADYENENNTVHILNDGKILVMANYAGGTLPFNMIDDYVLIRFNSNGTPDTGFGINGIVKIDYPNSLGGSYDRSCAMQVQADNKIIIGGYSNQPSFTSSLPDFAISRFNADGSKDLGFGTNGISRANFGNVPNNIADTEDMLTDLRIQADGKIIACGSTGDLDNNDVALVRFNANGSIDTAFGTDGHVVTDFGLHGTSATSLELQPDGKIVAVGNYFYNDDQNYKMIAARYNPDGSLDNTFGVGGKVMAEDGSSNPKALAFNSHLMGDGKIVLIGCVSNTTDTATASLLRLNTDGSYDTSFGNNGFLHVDVASNSVAYDLLELADGKIILGGSTGFDNVTSQFVLWKLEEPGLSAIKFASSAFSIAPNPFDDYINVDFNLLQGALLSFELNDSNGRLVGNLAEKKLFDAGKNSFHMNMPNLPEGIYFLKISDGANTTSVKLVK